MELGNSDLAVGLGGTIKFFLDTAILEGAGPTELPPLTGGPMGPLLVTMDLETAMDFLTGGDAVEDTAPPDDLVAAGRVFVRFAKDDTIPFGGPSDLYAQGRGVVVPFADFTGVVPDDFSIEPELEDFTVMPVFAAKESCSSSLAIN